VKPRAVGAHGLTEGRLKEDRYEHQTDCRNLWICLGLALTVDAVPVWAQKGPIKVGLFSRR